MGSRSGLEWDGDLLVHTRSGEVVAKFIERNHATGQGEVVRVSHQKKTQKRNKKSKSNPNKD